MTTFGPYQATVVDIHDGDTFFVDIVLVANRGHRTTYVRQTPYMYDTTTFYMYPLSTTCAVLAKRLYLGTVAGQPGQLLGSHPVARVTPRKPV